ncbi:CAMK/CAMKL/CHK1 protein kinase [Pseudozyma hubeiensis]|nr:CAMK/CAMKL/CHK1 protein kinase [Pseudozyma hubeiensis]
MSKPVPSAWQRRSEMLDSPTSTANEFPNGVESPSLGTSDNEDGMAYLRSMSYVHTSGRFSSYATHPHDDSRRGSDSPQGTLVNHSVAPTDYATSDNESHKVGKRRSPLKNSSSWEAELGGMPLEINPEAMRKMKYGRLRYIDGLRFFAAIIVLTSTVIGNYTPTWAVGKSILYPFNSNFALTLFLALQGRALTLPWLVSRKDAIYSFNEAAAKAKAAKAAKAAAPAKTLDEKAAPPVVPPPTGSRKEINKADFKLYGMAMISRPFRFLLPILFVTGVQYGVCRATGLYPQNPNFETLIGQRPAWCYANGSQWIITATNLFTSEDRPTELRSEAGPIFYLPWFFQNSYYLYGLTMIISILQHDTRVAFLLVLGLLNWCTLSYLAPALLGLLVAELDVSGQFARLRKNRMASWGVQGLCVVLFVLFLIVPQIRDPINEGLSHLQVIRPTDQNRNGANIYSVVKFTDVICSMLLLVFLELSRFSQRTLALAPFSMMGRQIGAAIVAVHAIVLWSIMPKVFPMTSDDSATSGAATNLAGIWALTLIITLALSGIFRVVIEIPSEVLGRATLIFFYGQEDIQQLSTVSEQHMDKARRSGYLMPIPSLGNPMAKLGLTKVPW